MDLNSPGIHRRRRRFDTAGRVLATGAAVLVLLTVLLLMGYLLFSALRLVGGSTVEQPVISGLQALPAARHLQLDSGQKQAFVLQDDGSIGRIGLAAETGSEAPVQTIFDNPSSAAVERVLPLAGGALLILDASPGARLVRLSGHQSGDPAGRQPEVTAVTIDTPADFDWPGDIRLAGAAGSGDDAHLALLDGRGRLLLLHMQQAAGDEDTKPELALVAARDLQDHPEEASYASLDADEMTSLLPDQNGGLFIGMRDGRLLHIRSGAEELQVTSLPVSAGQPLVWLAAVYRTGLLAADAAGLIRELTWTPGGEPMVIARYDCRSPKPPRISVSDDRRWLGCLSPGRFVRLFRRNREQPIWSRNLAEAEQAAASGWLFGLDEGGIAVLDDRRRLAWWRMTGAAGVTLADTWQPAWRQGQREPRYIWEPRGGAQSQPALNVVPLVYGTFKAGLLGMAVALPLALLSAIYTALLMPARWRRRIKPAVEILESLPTVILGMIGALWLAPVLQEQLFTLLFLLAAAPVAVVASGYYWSSGLRSRLPQAWRRIAPLLIFALILAALAGIGAGMERLLFGHGFSAWLERHMGWTYDLRNALAVALVLGLAIAPVIFSLIDDALSALPRRLQLGALALGASPWQAAWQVMLPGASAGLLAALLIGFGRALGETMIVLMVSSHTPVMESSVLRGLQAIAPTLASDMPEAVPGSALFRVLLLAALMLFLFTFCMNTAAEFLRRRLRRRYPA